MGGGGGGGGRLGKEARTCLTSFLKEEAAKSIVFFSGCPSHSMKSLSRPTSLPALKGGGGPFLFSFFSCPGPRLYRKSR